jgi:hypothetical protein
MVTMTATEKVQAHAERQHMEGATHGWRNHRFGMGYPRGHKDEYGNIGAPPTTFANMDYGRGYCAGWLEAAAFAGKRGI